MTVSFYYEDNKDWIFEYGKPPPKNSRYKGKIGNDTGDSYFGYTGRDEAKDDDKTVEKQKDGLAIQGFIQQGYIALWGFKCKEVLNVKLNGKKFFNLFG